MTTELIAAQAAMLIRRPVAEVFSAFVDPERTSNFWFTKGSNSLQPGKQVHWHWDMYGASMSVDVKVVEDNRRIVVEWPGYGTPTTVEWLFDARADGSTFVTITNSGFSGASEEIVQQAVSATEGFAFVLAGAKAWLEHGLALNLVADRWPDGLPASEI
jgi:uncharacterized protein YndB with AHSA1/START domain